MTEVNTIECRLLVRNLTTSLRFYTDTLSFKVETSLPDFAILANSSARLQLAEDADRSAGSTSTLWLDVSDIDSLHHTFSQYSSIEWGPELYTYGRKEFAVRDPDGNLIILSECDGDGS